MAEIYKIRNADGLFSTGGTWPTFNERGKVWNQRGHLSSHLAQLGKSALASYQGCEVVTYELVQAESGAISVNEHINKMVERRKRREAELQRQTNEIKRDRALADLKRIALEYPDLVTIP